MCVYRQRVRIHSFCTQQPKQPNKIEYDWHEDGFHLTSFYSVFVIRHSAFNIHSHHSHAKSIKFHWIQTSWMDCFNLLEKKYIFSSFILSFDEIFRYTRFVQNFLCIDICRFFFFFFFAYSTTKIRLNMFGVYGDERQITCQNPLKYRFLIHFDNRFVHNQLSSGLCLFNC